jgi:hypothetical protein
MKNRIKNLALTPIAFFILAKEINAEMKYDAKIAEMQANIGPYVAPPVVTEIWG